MSAPAPRSHLGGPLQRGYRLTPFAVWAADCPLGRRFDAADSEEEDDMDAGLAWALREVGT